jgi:DNA-binding Lrp family transcriptional regulator
MASALVLINTEMGSQQKVLEQLKTINGVQEAHELYSVYDIAAKVYADSIDQLKQTITGSIKKIPDTLNFLTLLTVEHPQTVTPASQDDQRLRAALLLASRNVDDS